MSHPIDQLPAFAAGTLSPPAAEEIAGHLRRCASCAADAASWSTLAAGIRAATLTLSPSDPPPFAAVRARLADDGGLEAPPFESVRARLADGAAPDEGGRQRVPSFDSVPARLAEGAARDDDGGLDVPSFEAVRARLSSAGVPRYAAASAPRRSAAARVAWGLLVRQLRLVGWRVWAFAVLVIGAGAGFAATAPASRAGELLSLVVPLVAALAVAAACGADGEAAELVRATPTSTRVLVLARLTLVLAVTVGVGALASMAMALPRGDLVLAELFLTWFGPLVPLSALSFALAVLWRPEVGAATVVGCWVVRMLAPSALLDRGLVPVLDALWQPGLPLLLGAVAVAAATIVLAPLTGRRGLRAAAS
ncbi:hypothetical protein O7635_29950 [Asanoa sp. WMMD1127]|uniref:zf-HC2 domain-containing protein n=1 Tax=Asanoa sp. WMMD1127 TaxID=3016107 RepID=UPI002416A919|nr:zf-HC2 domain-containing protein [Asanoa sp. WMMD1127]MDG4826093.1 hypothetical protein [Asanoa sp. WMMD1127]